MELFDTTSLGITAVDKDGVDRTGNYFPTPTWAADLILNNRIPYNDDSYFLEPTCGDGRWLDVIPQPCRKLGVELRADLVQVARTKGHTIIHGNALEVPFPTGITHAIGNPPFEADFIDALLDKLHRTLPNDNGLAAFVLPTYYLQTSVHAYRLAQRWEIDVELIPRDIYPGLSKPLMLTRLWRNKAKRGLGLFLYAETVDMRSMNNAARDNADRKTWAQFVLDILEHLGGEATLEQMYRAASSKRPTANPFWQEQLRKVLRKVAINTDRGVYRHPLYAKAA